MSKTKAVKEDYKNKKPIMRAICLYDSTVEHEVKIIKWHTLYGSGDYEDEEYCDDREVECYYIWYEDLTQKGVFNAGAGACLSLEEAMALVEKNYNVKKWLNKVKRKRTVK